MKFTLKTSFRLANGWISALKAADRYALLFLQNLGEQSSIYELELDTFAVKPIASIKGRQCDFLINTYDEAILWLNVVEDSHGKYRSQMHRSDPAGRPTAYESKIIGCFRYLSDDTLDSTRVILSNESLDFVVLAKPGSTNWKQDYRADTLLSEADFWDHNYNISSNAINNLAGRSIYIPRLVHSPRVQRGLLYDGRKGFRNLIMFDSSAEGNPVAVVPIRHYTTLHRGFKDSEAFVLSQGKLFLLDLDDDDCVFQSIELNSVVLEYNPNTSFIFPDIYSSDLFVITCGGYCFSFGRDD